MLLNKVSQSFLFIYIAAIVVFSFNVSVDPNIAVGFYAVVRASIRASPTSWRPLACAEKWMDEYTDH
ncbi:hypothetical protein ACOSQ2_006389 [Xanthoceras sorbifolium]